MDRGTEIKRELPHVFENEFNTRWIRKVFTEEDSLVYILIDENCHLDTIVKEKKYKVIPKTEAYFWELLMKGCKC